MPMYEVMTVSRYGSVAEPRQEEYPDWATAKQAEYERDPLYDARDNIPVTWARVCPILYGLTVPRSAP
jgi:hypothetical protein